MQDTKTLSATLAPNPYFSELASGEQLERTVQALERNGIHAAIAENSEEAEKLVFDMLPDGAEVFTSSSQTLERLGIPSELEKSGAYDVVRKKLAKMDRKTQNREMVRMGAAPQYVLGSVHAVTEDGRVIVASNTGSQLGPYAAGAARVIWVVGAQKIVRDLEEGLRRVEEYSYPLEDQRLLKAKGVHSAINKLLIVNRESQPGRTSMVIVKENLGF